MDILSASPRVCILPQWVDISVESKKSVKSLTNPTKNFIPSLELLSHHLSTVESPYPHGSSAALGMQE